jgi:hypothetical protein
VGGPIPNVLVIYCKLAEKTVTLTITRTKRLPVPVIGWVGEYEEGRRIEGTYR